MVSISIMDDSLLTIENLAIDFWTEEGVLKAVRGIDLSLQKGEVLGIVGESGCGKSVTALSTLRLIPSPPGRIREGKILFRGKDLLTLNMKEMRRSAVTGSP